ncbi:MAG: Xaa-Pro dipeptidase, partial [Acholeplasmataceae bacterium]|nr:Xaa-Pro dipeptidase [Acholeplasmataceae bacterium]
NINNIHQEIAALRMIKSSDEIDNIKKAIKITNEALNNVLKNIKSGIYEYEVVADYNYILGKHNVEPSFDTIAASGHNATVLHYVENNSVIPKNSLMLFDLGVNYSNYASDISRTYPVDGKFTPRQKEFYELVLKANKETIKMLKPGVTWKEFNDYAKDILSSGLIKMGLIKEKEEISKYYYHSIGHFLGLDVHDVGVYNVALQAGMVVTVEPGLYISEEDIGIRIEDDILITENGSINLSIDIPKEIDEIEKLMK